MVYGNAVGTLTFVWKIDQPLSDHEVYNAHVLVKVAENLPRYATRDMEKTFIERYSDVAKCFAMVLRSTFREHTQDSSAATTSKEG